MNSVSCPRCGAANPPNAAFCGTCGAPIAVQQPASSEPLPPPPPSPMPPPVVQPTAVYPPMGPAKVMGDKTKWALGLGVVALFCCGPIAAIPGFIMAKKDMDEIAAGRAPQLDASWAKIAYYLNIIALVLFVVGLCFWWGLGGMRRF